MQSRKNQPFSTRLRFAVAGLGHALRTEQSLKTQAIVSLLVVIALIVLRPAPLWWALVILSSAGVLAAEMFNTAVEHLADYLQPEQHPEIRIVKDCAAAGVLLMALGASGVALVLLIDLMHR